MHVVYRCHYTSGDVRQQITMERLVLLIVAFQAGLSHLSRRASPPSPLSIFDGEGEEVLVNELLRLLEARYGATVAHLRRIFLIFPWLVA